LRDGPVAARTSVGSLLDRHGVGIRYRDGAELADRLQDAGEVGRRARRMRQARGILSFDTHVDRLAAFLGTGQGGGA
jgi:hypothetical protein